MLAPSLPRPNKGRGGEGGFCALGVARFVLCWGLDLARARSTFRSFRPHRAKVQRRRAA